MATRSSAIEGDDLVSRFEQRHREDEVLRDAPVLGSPVRSVETPRHSKQL
jgi:hypothetical protein